MESPYSLQQIVNDEVAPSGESVVWSGQPNPIRLMMTAIPIILFGLPWTAFSIFWMAAASGFSLPDFSKPGFTTFFPLFGMPFVLIGLGMLLAPVFAYTKAFRTYYIITNKSARIVTLGRIKKVTIYNSGELGEIERREKSDGSGDIIFKKRYPPNARSTSTGVTGFYGIQNVKAVEEFLRSIQHTIVPTS